MSEEKCIYCGKKGKLDKSDIIPDFMTNRKVCRTNVCKECNSACSKFESKVSYDLDFILNHLEIKGKDSGKIRPFKTNFQINGITFARKITTKSDLFNGGIAVANTDDGNYQFGPVGNFKKRKNFNTEKLEYFDNKAEMFEITRLNSEIFYSNEILRMVAKIGYEWFCRQNEIDECLVEFKKIRDFILYNKTSQPSYIGLVEVVIDKNLYYQINNGLDLGGHSLSINYQRNGKIYVLFSMFGLVIYKIWIKNTSDKFTNGNRMGNFFCIRADGSTNELLIVNSPSFKILSKAPHIGVNELMDIISENYIELKRFKYASLRVTRIYMERINKLAKMDKTDEQFNKLLGYKDERLIFNIILLKKLAENQDSIDYTLNYNSNLINILNIKENYVINLDNEFKNLSREYYKENLLYKLVIGYKIFMKFYNHEVV